MKTKQNKRSQDGKPGVYGKELDGPSRDEINMLMTFFEQRRYAEGEALAKRLAARFPQNGIIWKTLGAMLNLQGKDMEAIAPLQKTAELLPKDIETHINLGIIFERHDRFMEAEASYRRALEIKPDYAEVHNSLGIILKGQDRLMEAEISYRRALEIKPDYAEACNNLGNTLKDLGQFAQAEVSYRRALEIKPDYTEVHSNLLFVLNCTNSHTPSYCLEEACRYGRMVSIKAGMRFSAWRCNPKPSRLRVGLVSGDLRNHPVGYFLEGILTQIDTSRVELIAYPTACRADELTDRIKPFLSAWTPLVGLKDEAAAHLIHADSIHILLDLSGHTGHNRLPIFAWKPAPVQVSWLGYSGTTGMPQMDYYLGDPFVAPREEERNFTERIWHLPESYLCLTQPAVPVEIGLLPALIKGHITFGCFNNLIKISDAVVALWSRVLHAISGSKLFLRSRHLSNSTVVENTFQRFAARGITSNRLILDGAYSSRRDLFEAYHHVDIALDPFPYPGTTTSVEGLWMGVPLITRRGDRFLSRVGESIVHNAGLDDWIAENDDDYVAKALMHTANLERLAVLRRGLRRQVLSSPLFDAPRFARHFEAALWDMWNHHQSCV